MIKKRGQMLLHGFPHIALGLFDCLTVVETAWESGAVGKVAFIFGLFFDHDFKRIELHGQAS